MATQPNPAVTQQPSVEDKILAASEDAAQIAGIFAPGIGVAIQAGVAAEPLISGFAHLIIGIFHHHTGVKKAG